MITYIFVYNVVAIKANFSKLIRYENQKMVLIGGDYCLDRLTPENKSCFFSIHRLSGRDFHEVNASEVEELVLSYIKTSGAKNIRLLTNEDSTQLTLADLREKYGIPGVSRDQILPFVDKVVSKQRLDGVVRMPKFVKFDKKKYIEDKKDYLRFLVNTLGFPMFIKPIDLVSSIDTYYIPILSKLETVAERILSSQYEFEVDEYIESDLYNCDALVFDKQIKAFMACRYLYVPAMFQKGFPIPILQIIDEELVTKLQQFCQKTLVKLGFLPGGYHLEAFFDRKKREFVFLEISARIGGALIPNMWEKYYGIHTEEFHYLIQMNLVNEIKLEDKKNFAASITYPIKTGEVLSTSEPEIDIEHKFELYVKPGEIVTAGKNLLDMSASIIFWDKSYQKVCDTIERLKKFQPLKMVINIPTLERSDEITKMLFDVIPYVFWKDINGIYQGGNINDAAIFGFKYQQDFIGKNIYELAGNISEASIIDNNDNMVMRENRTYVFEEKITDSTGVSKVYYSQKSPIRDSFGKVAGMFGFSIDITDVKKTEEEFRKIVNILFDSIPFIFWKDIHGVYQGANLNEVINLGLKSPDDMIGKTSFDITSDIEAAKQVVDNDNKVMKEDRTYLVEETINGKTYYSQKTPIHDELGNVTGMLGFSMDITEQKKIEEELRKQREQALLSKEAAELSNEIKTQFIQNMEHDLRTPASGVSQMLKILTEEETDPRKKDVLAQLAKASQRLLDLLNDIVSFDKMAAQDVTVLAERVDIHELAQSIVDLEIPTILEKKLELTLKVDPKIPQYIITDRSRVFRILLNLIGNAIKFTHKGYVKITLKIAKQMGPKNFLLMIRVEDTGIGIPKDKINRIYERFERCVPSNKGLYAGSGLGLSITKQFVNELNGEIDVKSVEGHGTIFTCFIPCAFSIFDINNSEGDRKENLPAWNAISEEKISKPRALTSTANPNETAFSNKRVLLVEDDPVSGLAETNILRNKLHVNCSLAKTGEEALNLYANNKYDIIFMDVGLPDMTGVNVILKIRETDKEIPIVAVTAHDMGSIKILCKDAGANDFITKPFDLEKAAFALQKFLTNEVPSNFKIPEPCCPNEQLSEDQILDFSLCIKIASGDEIVAGQLWTIFAKQIEKYLKDIKVAFVNNDLRLLHLISHKLKGGATYAGAARLTTAATLLSDAAKTKEVIDEDVRRLFDNVIVELLAVKEAFKRLGY